MDLNAISLKQHLLDKSMIITPITSYNGILLKRDDNFVIGDVNGGKLRQCIYLLINNYDAIVKRHNRKVVCSCSINSPQSAITATVCKQLGFDCNIVTYKTSIDNRNLTIAQSEGANIYGTTSGYTSVIDSYAKNHFKDAFFINMGFSSDGVLNANYIQAVNIPYNLDYLVVPVGSAMNFLSIIKGLHYYGNKPKRIIGVYVGKDPKPTINKYFEDDWEEYKPLIKLIKYPASYGTHLNINNNLFDPVYEAKAYDWIVKNLDAFNNKILLWIVGKRNMSKIPQAIHYRDFERRLN